VSTDDWCSPRVIRAGLEQLGGVQADPCTNGRSIIKSTVRYTAGGLHLPWRPRAYVRRRRWMVYENPPYSRLGLWTDKGIRELLGHYGPAPTEIIRLVPVATSAAWWRRAHLIEAPKGLGLERVQDQIDPPLVIYTKRLPFIDENGVEGQTARFDSVLFCYFQRERARRVQAAIKAFAPITSVVINMAEHNYKTRRMW
jgi:hypothetical protein